MDVIYKEVVSKAVTVPSWELRMIHWPNCGSHFVNVLP